MLRLGLLAALVAACVDAPDEATTAPQPLVGVDGSHDSADRNCNVVLRELGRTQTGFTYLTSGSSWVWQGTVEISEGAAAEGLTPSVLFHLAPNGPWFEAQGAAVQAPATPGFVRYAITLDHDLPGPGWSGSSLSSARIEAVPFLKMPQGGRLFDHNRNAGDAENYAMTAPDLAIWRNDAVCAPPAGPTRAKLSFNADWTVARDGVLAPGGELTIAYAQTRLDGCHYESGGHQLWDITAHVKFEPGGQLLGASVRDGQATMTVPSDARRATIWFESTSASGCHQWDSNYGNNYVFDAATPPQWVGNASTLNTRDTTGDICGGTIASSGFAFDTWVRQRAAITNLCFEIYQPGMTDHDDPELWQKLDVSLHWREGNGAWQAMPVSFDRRVGNNARYVLSWRALDPLRPYHCPTAPTMLTPDGYVQSTLEYYIVVNGYELRPAPSAAFAGIFTDYKDDVWRSQNCQ
ncbi:MAG TPA: DUF6209 family protein [Kofleriaceae bacterium]|nr:DUF6209 family protein [Kofleriaceae bacterium]